MIKILARTFLSVVYGVLIVQMAGFSDIANAAASATSCQDVIPNTSYKYFDTLSYFTSFYGKTYAISKSAIGSSLPAANYFAMDAGITYEYSQGGQDLNSLKYKINLGTYGTARPVSIPNQATLDFVKKRYGKFMGSAASANSTYVDGWKEYGLGSFDSLSGAPLPFLNFQTPPTPTYSPAGLVMGSDGWFSVALNGTRTSQIVEFDGEMDCAVKYVDPTTIVPPTCTNGQILVNNQCTCPTGQKLIGGYCQVPPPGTSDLMCGQDLNMDGFVDPNEMSNCQTTPQGNLCPVGALDCTASYQDAMCPQGSTLNTVRDMCQADPSVACPNLYTWDKSIDRCVLQVTCSEGGQFSQSTQRCEKTAQSTCPPNYFLDVSNGICTKPVVCPDGGILSPSADRCELPASFMCSAPGYFYNALTKLCEMPPLCLGGSVYSTTTKRCEQAVANCPVNYIYDAALNTCVSSAICPDGSTFSLATNSCEQPGSPTCEVNWTFNPTTSRCEQAPSCTPPGAYYTAEDLCLAPVSGTSCPTNYLYDPISKSCTEAPICPSGTFNLVSNKCEATPLCSSGFSFSTVTGRCESSPSSCPSGYLYSTALDACTASVVCQNGGVLNNSTNLCEQQVTLTCNSAEGWALNATTKKCEKAPTCATPGTYSTTSKTCTAPVTSVSCPINYTWDPAKNVCTEVPKCSSGVFNPTTQRCETAASCPINTFLNTTTGRCEATPVCSVGYSYSPVLDKCVATPDCGTGTLNTTTGTCDAVPTVVCPNLWNFNTTSGKCEQAPTCAAPGTYSAILDACTTGAANAGCPINYSFDPALNTCKAAPVCAIGTNYNPTSKTCQMPASYVCSDPSYTYNIPSGRCEKTPVCTGGTYNTTYNKCLQAELAAGCAAGYNWNPTRLRCEMQPPQCVSGTTYNVTTNRCEAIPTCNSGTYSAATDNCYVSGTIYNATLVGGITFDVPIYGPTDAGSYGALLNGFSGSLYGYAATLANPQPPGSAPMYRRTWEGNIYEYWLAHHPLYGYAAAAPLANPAFRAVCWNSGVMDGLFTCGPNGEAYNIFYDDYYGSYEWMWGNLPVKGYLATVSGTFGGTPTCSSGGIPTTNPVTGVTTCSTVVNVTALCPLGSVLDPATDVCYANPNCPGGNFDGVNDVCWSNISKACPINYGYIAERDRCEYQPPTCQPGSTYNLVTDKCESQAPSSYPAVGTPVLGGIVLLNTGVTGCTSYADDGYGGLYCTAWGPVTVGCHFGNVPGVLTVTNSYISGTVNNALCGDPWWMVVKSAYLQFRCGGQIYTINNSENNTVSFSCPTNDLTWIDGFYYVDGTGSTTCPAGTTPVNNYLGQPGYCQYTASNQQYACPSGGTLTSTASGPVCNTTTTVQQNPTCAGGNFDGVNDVCWTDYIKSCPPGMLWDGAIGYCAVAATCANGLLDGSVDKCFQMATLSCPIGTTMVGSTCEATPSCSGSGVFDSALNICKTAASYSCSAVGYIYDPVTGNCNQAATCGIGSLNTVTDICQTPNTLSCPSGFTQSGSTCQKAPGCVIGGTYSNAIGQCVSSTAPCATGLSLDPISEQCFTAGGCITGQTLSGAICYQSPFCDAGGLFSTTLNLCSGAGTYNCDIGYTYSSGLSLCTQTADCGTGSLNPVSNLCEMVNVPTCPGGYLMVGLVCQQAPDCGANAVYDATGKVCRSTISACPLGTSLDPVSDKCFASATCPGTLAVTGNVCSGDATCDPGGALDATGVCRSSASYSCDPGFSYSPSLGKCFVPASCAPGSLDMAADVCSIANTLSCPSGFTLNGLVCWQNPTCQVGGTYSPSIQKCDGGNNVCPVSWTLDTNTDLCYQDVSCPGGVFDLGNDKCTTTGSGTCPASGAYTFETSTELCVSQPVCSPGSYDPNFNTCKMAIIPDCGTYAQDPATGVCYQAVSCPTDPTFSLNSTIAFAPSINMCASDAEHKCVSDTAYNGLPVQKCEAVPICAGAVKYDPVTHSCYMGQDTCPLGSQYTCMTGNTGSVPRCSANVCGNPNDPNLTTETKLDDNMYSNDGTRDAAGNCTGQLMIFNGKPSRCRPPGLIVGMINNCCESDTIIPEDMGDNIQNGISTVQTLYDVGTLAYYTYQMSTGAMTMAEVGTAVYDASTAVMQGIGAAMEAVATGMELATALTDALMTYCSALVTSPAFIIGIVIMVVMKVLMGKGCDKTDIQTGSGVASKQCHYIGDYCEKKTFMGCIQRAKGYCCFNSKIGRIIHEQGRPQLNAFQPNGDWGPPQAPNCRGFSPEEFSALNFSTIDLSEYFEDVTKDLDAKVSGAKAKAEDMIKQRYDQIK